MASPGLVDQRPVHKLRRPTQGNGWSGGRYNRARSLLIRTRWTWCADLGLVESINRQNPPRRGRVKFARFPAFLSPVLDASSGQSHRRPLSFVDRTDRLGVLRAFPPRAKRAATTAQRVFRGSERKKARKKSPIPRQRIRRAVLLLYISDRFPPPTPALLHSKTYTAQQARAGSLPRYLNLTRRILGSSISPARRVLTNNPLQLLRAYHTATTMNH